MNNLFTKYRFCFVGNALTKRIYFKAIVDIVLGKSKKRFVLLKQNLAAFFGVKPNQVFLFAAGRMGLYIFLKALNLKQEDEVILTGYTCVVVSNAVKYIGCKVKYVDITKETLNLDTEKLLSAITSKTKVVVIAHNFGLVYADIQKIKSTFPDIMIIEDAAHTFGSCDANMNLCGKLGDAAFFSFEYSKPLTTGFGGLLLVNNLEILPKVEILVNDLHEFSKKDIFRICITLSAYVLTNFKCTQFFFRISIGLLRKMNLTYTSSIKEVQGEKPKKYPAKLSPALSVFAYHQLYQLQEINTIKKQITYSYFEIFKDFKDLKIYYNPQNVGVQFPVVFNSRISIETIQKIKIEAANNGFRLSEWFNSVIHPKGSFQYLYESGSCPVGEHISERIVNFPININRIPNKKELLILKRIFIYYGIH